MSSSSSGTRTIKLGCELAWGRSFWLGANGVLSSAERRESTEAFLPGLSILKRAGRDGESSVGIGHGRRGKPRAEVRLLAPMMV